MHSLKSIVRKIAGVIFLQQVVVEEVAWHEWWWMMVRTQVMPYSCYLRLQIVVGLVVARAIVVAAVAVVKQDSEENGAARVAAIDAEAGACAEDAAMSNIVVEDVDVVVVEYIHCSGLLLPPRYYWLHLLTKKQWQEELLLTEKRHGPWQLPPILD